MRKEDTVKLISAEGFEFVIDRKAALVSNTLKNMLTSSGKWERGSIPRTREGLHAA
jgi:transcription elongation factor B subunit 1